MHEDLQWAMSRGSELEQQYPGEYLIIWQKQVIAHGIDSEELLDTLSSKERPREELVVFECPAFFESPR